jgi:hypothetical protein
MRGAAETQKTTRKVADPEASVGITPDGYYLGYRSLLIDMEGLPLGRGKRVAKALIA